MVNFCFEGYFGRLEGVFGRKINFDSEGAFIIRSIFLGKNVL